MKILHVVQLLRRGEKNILLFYPGIIRYDLLQALELLGFQSLGHAFPVMELDRVRVMTALIDCPNWIEFRSPDTRSFDKSNYLLSLLSYLNQEKIITTLDESIIMYTGLMTQEARSCSHRAGRHTEHRKGLRHPVQAIKEEDAPFVAGA